MLLLHLFIIIREYKNIKKEKKEKIKRIGKTIQKCNMKTEILWRSKKKNVLHILEKSVNKYRKSVTDK